LPKRRKPERAQKAGLQARRVARRGAVVHVCLICYLAVAKRHPDLPGARNDQALWQPRPLKIRGPFPSGTESINRRVPLGKGCWKKGNARRESSKLGLGQRFEDHWSCPWDQSHELEECSSRHHVVSGSRPRLVALTGALRLIQRNKHRCHAKGQAARKSQRSRRLRSSGTPLDPDGEPRQGSDPRGSTLKLRLPVLGGPGLLPPPRMEDQSPGSIRSDCRRSNAGRT